MNLSAKTENELLQMLQDTEADLNEALQLGDDAASERKADLIIAIEKELDKRELSASTTTTA